VRSDVAPLAGGRQATRDILGRPRPAARRRAPDRRRQAPWRTRVSTECPGRVATGHLAGRPSFALKGMAAARGRGEGRPRPPACACPHADRAHGRRLPASEASPETDRQGPRAAMARRWPGAKDDSARRSLRDRAGHTDRGWNSRISDVTKGAERFTASRAGPLTTHSPLPCCRTEGPPSVAGGTGQAVSESGMMGHPPLPGASSPDVRPALTRRAQSAHAHGPERLNTYSGA